jgi:hypothetical protein
MRREGVPQANGANGVVQTGEERENVAGNVITDCHPEWER